MIAILGEDKVSKRKQKERIDVLSILMIPKAYFSCFFYLFLFYIYVYKYKKEVWNA
jgi:hypothetical protein